MARLTLQFAVLQAVLVTCAAFVAAPVWRNEWPRSFISAQLHNEPHDRDIRTPSERIEAMGEPMQVGYVREEVDAKGANQKHNIQEMVALDTWWAVGEEAAAAVQLPAEWIVDHTASGRVFYRNIATGVLTHTHPGEARSYRYGQWGQWAQTEAKCSNPRDWIPHWTPPAMEAQPETSAQHQQRASETLLRRQLDQINAPPLGAREDETRTLVRRAMFDARAEPQTTGVSLAESATCTLVRHAMHVSPCSQSSGAMTDMHDEIGLAVHAAREEDETMEVGGQEGVESLQPLEIDVVTFEDTCAARQMTEGSDTRRPTAEHSGTDTVLRQLWKEPGQGFSSPAHPLVTDRSEPQNGHGAAAEVLPWDEDMENVLAVLFRHDLENQQAQSAGATGLTSFEYQEIKVAQGVVSQSLGQSKAGAGDARVQGEGRTDAVVRDCVFVDEHTCIGCYNCAMIARNT